MSADLVTFARDLAGDTKSYVTKTVAHFLEPITARLVALEQRVNDIHATPGPPGDAGAKGDRGEKGDPGEPGLAGQDGHPGKDADLSLLLALQSTVAEMRGEWSAYKAWHAEKSHGGVDALTIERLIETKLARFTVPTIDEAAIVQRVVDAIPTPKDGEPGPPGPPGPMGLKGDKGLDGEPGPVGPIGPMGHQGEKGLDGAPGRDGRDGLAGPQGEKGLDGKDGKDGAPGRDGLNGKDGADGLSLDTFDVVCDEQKGHIFSLTAHDGTVITKSLASPWDAGTYKRGRIYPKGALVTFHGSWYSAQVTTSAVPGQPDASSRDWRLVAKSGKDGRHGRDGKDGL